MGPSHSILPPHFIGRVSPSRHDAALAAYMEEQAAQRAAVAARQAKPKDAQRPWRALLQAARQAAVAVWQLQHDRFTLSHLKDALK